MNDIVNHKFAHADRFTPLQAAALLLEIDIDAMGKSPPQSVRMLADRLERSLTPEIARYVEDHWDTIHEFHYQTLKKLAVYSLPVIKAWAESNTDLRPAVLFPAEEIAREDFGPDDFETFLQKDPTVELFAKILFALERQDGKLPEQAEIRRTISTFRSDWSKTLLDDAARAIQNFLKVTQ
jgi:hypothetical protein